MILNKKIYVVMSGNTFIFLFNLTFTSFPDCDFLTLKAKDLIYKETT